MSDDKNWEKMVSQWQSCKIATVDTAKDLEDIKALKTKTRRKANSMKFFMVGDIIGAVVILVVFGYQLIFKNPDLFTQTLFGGTILILMPMAFLSVWFRKGAWSAAGNDTRSYLELALKRSISAIKLAKATAFTSIVAGLFIVGALLWKASVEYSELKWPWNRFVFGITFEAILFISMYYGSRWYEKRKLTEKIKLESMLNDLDSDR